MRDEPERRIPPDGDQVGRARPHPRQGEHAEPCEPPRRHSAYRCAANEKSESEPRLTSPPSVTGGGKQGSRERTQYWGTRSTGKLRIRECLLGHGETGGGEHFAAISSRARFIVTASRPRHRGQRLEMLARGRPRVRARGHSLGGAGESCHPEQLPDTLAPRGAQREQGWPHRTAVES